MTIPEAIRVLYIMYEPGQERNNKALDVAIEIMKQHQKWIEMHERMQKDDGDDFSHHPEENSFTKKTYRNGERI